MICYRKSQTSIHIIVIKNYILFFFKEKTIFHKKKIFIIYIR